MVQFLVGKTPFNSLDLVWVHLWCHDFTCTVYLNSPFCCWIFCYINCTCFTIIIMTVHKEQEDDEYSPLPSIMIRARAVFLWLHNYYTNEFKIIAPVTLYYIKTPMHKFEFSRLIFHITYSIKQWLAKKFRYPQASAHVHEGYSSHTLYMHVYILHLTIATIYYYSMRG